MLGSMRIGGELARDRHRLHRASAPVTSAADEDDRHSASISRRGDGRDGRAPPPRIDVVSDVVALSFADTSEALADVLPGADVVLAWRPRSSLLRPVWPKADAVKWIQTASAGVDALLFPELVESHVVVTNARGIFDRAIAEFVLGTMLAFAKGLPGCSTGRHAGNGST